MKQFTDMISKVKTEGVSKPSRPGIGTQSVFGLQQHFDLREGFPLLGLKFTSFKLAFHELMWVINGSDEVAYLIENGVTFWNQWLLPDTIEYGRELTYDEMVAEIKHRDLESKLLGYTLTPEYYRELTQQEPREIINGSVGPLYPVQWRNIVDTLEVPQSSLDDPLAVIDLESRGYSYRGEYYHQESGVDIAVFGRTIDQLSNAIELLKMDPYSRRIVINTWNPCDLDWMSLTPCHPWVQFDVQPGPDDTKVLNLMITLRSNDMFLGAPYNIAFYALLCHAAARETGMSVGHLVYSVGNAHIYNNHTQQVDQYLERAQTYEVALPTLTPVDTGKPFSIFTMTLDDWKLEGYEPLGAIKAPVAV